jgi:hypothetical protein
MKYVNHKFTNMGVRVQFNANGAYIRFFTPNTPINELPERAQDEATNLWTAEYVDAYLESLKPSIEQWRNTFKTDLYKLKIILDTMGDLEAVEGIIAQQPKGVQLAWENANTVRRNSPTVAGLAQAMEYSDETLDTIFKQADEVEL